MSSDFGSERTFDLVSEDDIEPFSYIESDYQSVSREFWKGKSDPIPAMDKPERARYGRNFDGGATLGLQLAIDQDQLVAIFWADGTATEETETVTTEVGDGGDRDTTRVTNENAFRIPLDRYNKGIADIVGTKEPVALIDQVEVNRVGVVGDRVMQRIARVSDDRDVLRHYNSAEWIVEFLLGQGHRNRPTTDRDVHSTREAVKECLADNRLYDSDDPDHRDHFNEKVQGFHSTIGMMAIGPEGIVEEHTGMKERGIYGDVLETMRDDRVCRVELDPILIQDGYGAEILYEAPDWNKRFSIR
jgi:hypothetical protein